MFHERRKRGEKKKTPERHLIGFMNGSHNNALGRQGTHNEGSCTELICIQKTVLSAHKARWAKNRS